MTMNTGAKRSPTTGTSQQSCSFNDLSAGQMGKLLVYKSGAVKLKLGEFLYDVSIDQRLHHSNTEISFSYYSFSYPWCSLHASQHLLCSPVHLNVLILCSGRVGYLARD